VTDLAALKQEIGVNQLKLVPSRHVDLPKLKDFESVYNAEWSHVWVYLQRLGVEERDLFDLTQEVFLRAFRAWRRCDFTRPLRPWLFGISYHVVLGFRRQARHRLEVATESTEARDIGPTGDDIVALGEHRRHFLAALEGMGVRRRAVFVLHEIEGYTAPEIAEALGEPLNTVYSRLRLARRDFSAAIRELRRNGDLDD